MADSTLARICRRIAVAGSCLLTITSVSAQAQVAASNGLNLLQDLSRMAPYIGTPVVESSADVLLQLPGQVDGVAPVPVNVRVLSAGAEWITLLAESDKPRVLARFSLDKSALPEVSTRFRSGSEHGVLAVVTFPERILTAQRSYTVVTVKGAGSKGADKSSGSSPDTLMLNAELDGDKTVVHLRTADTLVKQVQDSPEQPAYIQHFELIHDGKRVLSAELSADVWYKPFFRFAFKGGHKDDSVKLHWRRSDGAQGELSTHISAQ